MRQSLVFEGLAARWVYMSPAGVAAMGLAAIALRWMMAAAGLTS